MFRCCWSVRSTRRQGYQTTGTTGLITETRRVLLVLVESPEWYEELKDVTVLKTPCSSTFGNPATIGSLH